MTMQETQEEGIWNWEYCEKSEAVAEPRVWQIIQDVAR